MTDRHPIGWGQNTDSGRGRGRGQENNQHDVIRERGRGYDDSSMNPRGPEANKGVYDPARNRLIVSECTPQSPEDGN